MGVMQRRPVSGRQVTEALGEATRWEKYHDYQPEEKITKEFRDLIYEHRYVRAFETAIKTISEAGVPELEGITTLNHFYRYLDDLVTWTPKIRHWEHNGVTLHERTVYNRIVQFYIYMEQPQIRALQSPLGPDAEHPWEQQDSRVSPAPMPKLRKAVARAEEEPLTRYARAADPWDEQDRTPARKRTPIWHTAGAANLSPLSRWMVDFANAWGDYLDTARSAKRITSFEKAPEYSLSDYTHFRPKKGWNTFNEFFARRLNPGLRPIASADDPRVIVAAADSTYIGQWEVNEQSGVVVKHIEWKIKELLAGSQFAEDFRGGIFTHSFLNTFDYHRQHAPVAGKIIEATVIPGQCYLEVSIQTTDVSDPAGNIANAVVPARHLEAADNTGYQFVQSRGLIVIQSRIGKVAVLPMGMAQVSSVIITKRVGDVVEKGDEVSYFQFGGSDIVLVFERRANVSMTAAMNVHYNYGTSIGTSHINEMVEADL